MNITPYFGSEEIEKIINNPNDLKNYFNENSVNENGIFKFSNEMPYEGNEEGEEYEDEEYEEEDETEEKENDVMSEEEFKKVLEERRKNEVNEKWTPTEEQLQTIEKILEGKYKEPENNEIIEEPQGDLENLQEVLVTEDSGYSFEDASEFIPTDNLNVETKTENSDVIEGITASTLNPEVFDDNKTLRYTKLNKKV
jgi:hypothetical protein